MKSVNKAEQDIALHRHCPLCEATRVHIIISLPYLMWDDLNIDGYADLVTCMDCGMVYHDTVASEDDFQRYYSQNSYYAMAETAGSGGLGKKEKIRYQKILNTLKPYFSQNNPHIIDVGSGKGGFLSWCKDQGFTHLTAIEQSILCVDTINQDPVICAYNDLNRLNSHADQVDVIILSHVLEHIFNPLAFLDEIVKLASESTLFYIEVPNANFYIQEVDQWRYLYFEHINHFDDLHIEHLINQAGLLIVRKEMISFIPGIKNSEECLSYVCQKNKVVQYRVNNSQLAKTMKKTLAHNPPWTAVINSVLKNRKKPISIWGVSQYIQLMMGSSVQLQEKLKYLVDKSPAKQNRYIGGNEVFSPDKLVELEKDDILFIPGNIYGQETKDFLKRMNILAEVRIV